MLLSVWSGTSRYSHLPSRSPMRAASWCLHCSKSRLNNSEDLCSCEEMLWGPACNADGKSSMDVSALCHGNVGKYRGAAMQQTGAHASGEVLTRAASFLPTTSN